MPFVIHEMVSPPHVLDTLAALPCVAQGRHRLKHAGASQGMVTMRCDACQLTRTVTSHDWDWLRLLPPEQRFNNGVRSPRELRRAAAQKFNTVISGYGDLFWFLADPHWGTNLEEECTASLTSDYMSRNRFVSHLSDVATVRSHSMDDSAYVRDGCDAVLRAAHDLVVACSTSKRRSGGLWARLPWRFLGQLDELGSRSDAASVSRWAGYRIRWVTDRGGAKWKDRPEVWQEWVDEYERLEREMRTTDEQVHYAYYEEEIEEHTRAYNRVRSSLANTSRKIVRAV